VLQHEPDLARKNPYSGRVVTHQRSDSNIA
jgi:hypothetical protein